MLFKCFVGTNLFLFVAGECVQSKLFSISRTWSVTVLLWRHSEFIRPLKTN